jgi:hypothetical protein
MDRLYRFEAEFTSMIPIGPVADGLRIDVFFEGRVVEGFAAGATIRGIDYLRLRAHGVWIIDVRELIVRGSDVVEVQAGGYALPPAGFELPPPEIMSQPDFTWPDLGMALYGYATFRTAVPEWLELNRTVGIFSGVGNAGARTLEVEAHAFIPQPLAARAPA